MCSVCLIVPASVAADPGLEWGKYSEIKNTTNQIVNFEDRQYVGQKSNVDSLIFYPGIVFGERFNGQSVTTGPSDTYLSDFDFLIGNPAGPLIIEKGEPRENLSFFKTFSIGGVGLYGESWVGFPAPASAGEGSVAIYFEQPQSSFGFRVHAAVGLERYELGDIKVRCFDLQGFDLGTLIFTSLEWDTVHSLGIFRLGNERDIKGCTIENTDPKGVILDDFVFDFSLEIIS